MTGVLYFVADRGTGDGPAHCLVRVSTPFGAPHVACVGRALGERWLDLMGVAGKACLLAQHELGTQVRFDLTSYGVLVFEDDAALDAYLLDANEFDYRSRITRTGLDVSSEEPW